MMLLVISSYERDLSKIRKYGRRCWVPNCANSKRKEAIKSRLFNFPSNLKRCTMWLEAIGEPSLTRVPLKFLSTCRFVCQEHFLPAHITPQGRTAYNAVPEIFSDARPVLPKYCLEEFVNTASAEKHDLCQPTCNVQDPVLISECSPPDVNASISSKYVFREHTYACERPSYPGSHSNLEGASGCERSSVCNDDPKGSPHRESVIQELSNVSKVSPQPVIIMEDITLVEENLIKVEEVKQEYLLSESSNEEQNESEGEKLQPPLAFFLERKEKMEEETVKQDLKKEYSSSESPNEQSESHEELKPLAAVFIKMEQEMDEGTEQQEDPLASSDAATEEETKFHITGNADDHGDAELFLQGEVETPQSRVHEHLQNSFPKKRCSKNILDIGNQLYADEKLVQEILSQKKHIDDPKRIQADNKPFECFICKQNFKDKQYLNKHMLTHTRDNPFKCSICKKLFSQKRYLKKHTLIHTGEKPFGCSICKKLFSQKRYLDKHNLTHTGEKPFGCSICKKNFLHGHHLDKHKRIHTREKPFECSVCKKCFSNKNGLRSHERTHTGEKRFECSFCSKSFTRRPNLNRHKCIHSGEKPL